MTRVEQEHAARIEAQRQRVENQGDHLVRLGLVLAEQEAWLERRRGGGAQRPARHRPWGRPRDQPTSGEPEEGEPA